MWEVMLWPIVACVLFPLLLVYFGLHVVQRGIIFIHIAMAQMAAVGLFHYAFLRNFLLVSFDRDGAYLKGLCVRLWDFLFYALFGLVLTSFVRIAGVLLVFSYLSVPAVCGINLAQRIGIRLLLGWIIALVGGVAGLFLSYWWDLPSGAAIVCTFGALLVAVAGYALIRARFRTN